MKIYTHPLPHPTRSLLLLLLYIYQSIKISLSSIMFMNNQDCDVHIQSFMNLTALSKMMTTNKYCNIHCMQLLGKAYKKKTPKTGLMHMGRLVSIKSHEMAKKYLIPGLKRSEAVLNSRCMLCKQKCNNVLEYGFVAHNTCIKKKEVKLDGQVVYTPGVRVSGRVSISPDMVGHLKGLRKRERTYGGGEVYSVIKSGIDGVFPDEFSLDGYCQENLMEICRARVTAAMISLECLEKGYDSAWVSAKRCKREENMLSIHTSSLGVSNQ
jgi:hypothetical protein